MSLLPSLIYVALAFVLLVISKIIRDATTKYDDDEQLTGKDNPALGISVSGYYLSVFIIFIAAATGDFRSEIGSAGFIYEILIDLAYAIGGILALNLGRVVLDKVALPKFSVTKELVEDRNVGMGWVQAGSYIGTAVIVGSSLIGDGSWYQAIFAWVIAQLVLVIFIKFYELITPYNVSEQLENDNVAAGIALCGNVIAISIVIFGANAQSFTSWSEFYIDFAILAIVGFIILALSRIVVDKMMLPKSSLNDEIANDKNTAAAWIESAAAVGFASTIVFMI